MAENAKAQAEEDKLKAEKEKDEAEQHGYNVGVVETEDALRAEVPAVCRAYCAQTWEEQLRKSAEAALKGAETQVESQRKLANDIKGQLVTAKEQIAALRQQLD